MKYLSVCSGIEAATVAWHPLGWEAVAFSEIEPFPSAVLKHHYPHVPNLGDMTGFAEWPDANPDVLVGGTPCQSFSVAGLRKGLADPRGNLALTYLAIADRYRPEWLVWENVPGVLSSDGGRDFGSILGGMVELGYSPSYRVLDAQYVRVDRFGRAVPQRRRRVFVVGNSRDWRRAAAVLFERESLSGNTAPRREAREGIAGTLAGGARRGGYSEDDIPHVSLCLTNGGRIDGEAETFVSCEVSDALTVGANQTMGFAGDIVAHALLAAGADASEDGTGRGVPLLPVAVATNDSSPVFTDGSICPTLRVGTALEINSAPAVAFQEAQTGVREYDTAGTLRADGPGHDPVGTRVRLGWSVRRLTPTECERLQGFPDGYTAIPYRGKPAADGPRYKALGNSMAVNAMRWLGHRIQLISRLTSAQRNELAA